MATRRLEDLHPLARERAVQWLTRWSETFPEIALLITCTYRSPEEQARLYRRNRTREQIEAAQRRLLARGHERLAQVLASTPPQPGPPPRTPVTKAPPGTSFHQRFTLAGESGALAVDFVPVVDGKLAWGRADLIKEAGRIGEACGLTWSGRWGWEFVHLQYDDGGKLDPWELLSGSENA